MLRDNKYERVESNAAGRYPLSLLKVELGVWPGNCGGFNAHWLRWWDADGLVLGTAHEVIESERQARSDVERENARLREKLRLAGVDPNPS